MKNISKQKKQAKQARKRRIRAKVVGTANIPRLSVFKSSKHIYAQIINDDKGKTLASASDLELKDKKIENKDIARTVGEVIAEKAIKLNIKKVVFDRGGFKYHGRIKELAEASRKKGLKF